MKFSVNFLDEVRFELSLAREPSGQWVVRSLFPTFLERPGKPHLSLFFGEQFDVHFTANHGRPNVLRRKLVRVGAETAKRFADRATEAMIRNQAAALSMADLDALADEGWTAHLAHWAALARWMSPACKPGATLRLDEDALGSIVCSICRRCVSPRILASLDGWLAYPLLRWRDGDDEAQVRLLFHYPQGVWVPDPNGSPVCIAEPGWYYSDPNWLRDADLGIPKEKLDLLGTKLEKLLARFPKRASNTAESPPRFFSLIFGVYASQLLQLAVALAVQKAEAKRSQGADALPL